MEGLEIRRLRPRCCPAKYDRDSRQHLLLPVDDLGGIAPEWLDDRVLAPESGNSHLAFKAALRFRLIHFIVWPLTFAAPRWFRSSQSDTDHTIRIPLQYPSALNRRSLM